MVLASIGVWVWAPGLPTATFIEPAIRPSSIMYSRAAAASTITYLFWNGRSRARSRLVSTRGSTAPPLDCISAHAASRSCA